MKGGKHGVKTPGSSGSSGFSVWRFLPLFAVLLVGGWLVYLWRHASSLHITLANSRIDHSPHNMNVMTTEIVSQSHMVPPSSVDANSGASVSAATNKVAMQEMAKGQHADGTPEQLFFQKYFGMSSKSREDASFPIHDSNNEITMPKKVSNKASSDSLKESNIRGTNTLDRVAAGASERVDVTPPSVNGRKMPRVQPVLGEIPSNGVKPLYGKKHAGGDAIFALAANYPKLYYERFVGSLRKFGFHDDIVLSVSIPEKMKPGVGEYLQQTDCVAYGFDVDCKGKDNCKLRDDFFGYPDPRPYRTFANIRYALYEYWMQYYTDKSYILILDFRDTFFQANPFVSFGPLAQRTPRYDLKVFEENFKVKNIGKCVFNSLWVGKCFGRPALDALRDKPVLCSGSTLGSYEAIMHYTRTMLHSMDTVQCWKKGIESDQGYQNYLFYNGAFNLNGQNATAYKQGEGIVNTIGALNGHRVPKDMKGPLDTHWHARDKEGWIVNYDGTRSACVHQWDRWYGDLVGWIDKHVFDR